MYATGPIGLLQRRRIHIDVIRVAQCQPCYTPITVNGGSLANIESHANIQLWQRALGLIDERMIG